MINIYFVKSVIEISRNRMKVELLLIAIRDPGLVLFFVSL